jgi:hypothetical protein
MYLVKNFEEKQRRLSSHLELGENKNLYEISEK